MGMFVVGNDKTKGTPAVVTPITPVEPYPLLSRVKDDSNNDIGCVVGYYTDSNNQKYAVVCINKGYRPGSSSWGVNGVSIEGLPSYLGAQVLASTESATFNCDKILAQATASSTTAPSVTSCRNLSFTINNVTYYGQLPNVPELVLIIQNATAINNSDPSSSGSPISQTSAYWASNILNGNYRWDVGGASSNCVNAEYGTGTKNIVPILEIPIQ